MKKRAPNYWFLIFFFSLFATSAVAQGPADPGDDPMRVDSAKNVIKLKAPSNNEFTSHPNFLRNGKGSLIITNKSDSLYLAKRKKKRIYTRSSE